MLEIINAALRKSGVIQKEVSLDGLGSYKFWPDLSLTGTRSSIQLFQQIRSLLRWYEFV
jgi:hypothetical protein